MLVVQYRPSGVAAPRQASDDVAVVHDPEGLLVREDPLEVLGVVGVADPRSPEGVERRLAEAG